MESSVPSGSIRVRRRPGNGAWLLLFIVLVFQLSVLPDTLGIKPLGRVFNALAVAAFLGLAVIAFARGNMWRVAGLYVVPVLLVVAGISLNLARSISAGSVAAASALLPWLAALSVPFMRSLDTAQAWRIFYRFMLVASIVSALEYATVFGGLLNPGAVHTERGDFLKGVISLFYGLDDGTVHYRMYGIFAEPGTYAMYLLPAIAYAFVYRKWLALPVFIGCLYLTDSLGGYLSLAVLVVTYLFWRSRRRLAGLLLVIVVLSVGAYTLSGYFHDRYELKQNSRTLREENVTLFRDNFANIILSSPFGLPLTGVPMSELGSVTSNYLGSNFEIYTEFVRGGILAILGYTIFLVWVTWRSVRFLFSGHRDPTLVCALLTIPALLLFVVQRTSILNSALFAFLYAKPLLTAARARYTVRQRLPVSTALRIADSSQGPGITGAIEPP
jgi:hypothetical protein